MSARFSVFAVVPHFGRDERSNEWLGRCLQSLLAQTVPLQAIIVVDDHSPCSPESVVCRHSNVSLFRNASNTGPSAILDRVHAQVSADALLHQDSDDWSSSDRLEILLAAMRQHAAQMVGCQVREVGEDSRPVAGPPFTLMPEDPRKILLANPTAHPVLLPTSLVSCAFAREIGGFSTGLKFGADSEFIRRAILGGVVRNVTETCYFRRIHPHSLTQAPETGFGSPARLEVQKLIQARARELVDAFLAGRAQDFAPPLRIPPTQFTHILGPPIVGL